MNALAHLESDYGNSCGRPVAQDVYHLSRNRRPNSQCTCKGTERHDPRSPRHALHHNPVPGNISKTTSNIIFQQLDPWAKLTNRFHARARTETPHKFTAGLGLGLSCSSSRQPIAPNNIPLPPPRCGAPLPLASRLPAPPNRVVSWSRQLVFLLFLPYCCSGRKGDHISTHFPVSFCPMLA